jgi:deoxyribonuclease-1
MHLTRLSHRTFTCFAPIARLTLLLICALTFAHGPLAAEFATSFSKAKQIAREDIYFDQNRSERGTVYCGCQWEWKGKSGGRVDWRSCGYEVRAQENRAARTEWEHIMPAHSLGQQRQCWQKGGRKNCVANDPLFHDMHVDLYNLTPSVGEVNADRSNFRFSPLPNEPARHGACPSRVSFKDRQFEPRDLSKGFVARVYFYMHDRYNLPMSRQQERLLMAWDRQYSVSDWELERSQRIERVQGTSNGFVTGERQWTRGYKPRGEGLKGTVLKTGNQPLLQSSQPVIGNKNSDVYHLPSGVCPSYNRVAEKNREYFQSESAAKAAGYRKAGNCR